MSFPRSLLLLNGIKDIGRLLSRILIKKQTLIKYYICFEIFANN
jgi:hypothetical protein